MRSILYFSCILAALLLTPQIIDAHDIDEPTFSLTQSAQIETGSKSPVTTSTSRLTKTAQTSESTTAATETTSAETEEVATRNNLEELKVTALQIKDNLKAAFTTTADVASGIVDVIAATVPVISNAVTVVLTLGTLAWLTVKALYIIQNIAAESVVSIYNFSK